MAVLLGALAVIPGPQGGVDQDRVVAGVFELGADRVEGGLSGVDLASVRLIPRLAEHREVLVVGGAQALLGDARERREVGSVVVDDIGVQPDVQRGGGHRGYSFVDDDEGGVLSPRWCAADIVSNDRFCYLQSRLEMETSSSRPPRPPYYRVGSHTTVAV
jgi:hypothetical protein